MSRANLAVNAFLLCFMQLATVAVADERCDNSRAVRDGRYLYIRNFMPYVPRGQYLTYLWHAQATRAWEAHHRAGKTDAVTGRFFTNKPVEELYDTASDPYSINNLAGSAEHKEVMEQMRSRLRQWQLNHFDAALKVANIIDWIGEGYDFYKEALASCNTSVQPSYLGRIKKRVKITE